MGRIKTQFGLLVKFSIIRDPEIILEPLFRSERPKLLFAIKNEATIEDVFICFINEVKGRDRGMVSKQVWLGDRGILEAFVNVALYEPFRGESYMPLPKSCKIRI